jgi:glutamate decarboxylase
VANKCVDYPLPPNEEKTEILRVVVRESLSLDMIDRLVADIIQVMEQLQVGLDPGMHDRGSLLTLSQSTDATDLAAWQPSNPSAEKSHASLGHRAHNRHKAKRPMHEGVHRSVC